MLIDESGLLMAPLVRRSWAPRGHPPELRQKGRHREKVSVAAALWLSPHLGRAGLVYRTLANGYFASAQMAEFVSSLSREAGRPVVVVWDGGTMHKGDPMRAMLRRRRGRVRLERLPPYAPMLNPVEAMWGWLKYSRLNNYAPASAAELDRRVAAELAAVRDDQDRLRAFWRQSELPDPLTLLS